MKTGHLLVIVYIFGITSAVTGCETDGSAKISREEISTESLKRLWRDLANESRMSLLDMRDIPVAFHVQRLRVEMINSDLFSFWTHEKSIEQSF